MSVLVPVLPCEVLAVETPVSGDPAEAHEAEARLNRVSGHLQHLVDTTRSACAHLSANQSLTIERVELVLSERVQRRAQAALAVSEAGSSAFRSYGEQIESIHSQARKIEDRVSEQLAEIRGCVSEAREILAMLQCSVQLHWNIGVPLELPRPDADYGDAAENAELRARYESQWCVAALRWRSALEELQLLQRQWRSLLDDRVEAERIFVSKLERLSDGDALHVSDSIEVSTVIVPAISTSRQTTIRVGAAIKPGERRSHPLLTNLYDEYALQLATTGKSPPAEAVEQWWWRLTESQRQQLIAEAPLVVGNLAGVPLESRVAANARSAEYFANAEGISAQEAGYWNRVAAGRVKLVVSDPGNSRIVEMIGEAGPDTARVITFLPGTMSQMKHFYAGSAQQVAQYLVTRSSGTSVAFVYKDGSWVSWLGPGANTNYDRLQELGGQVAEFQREVVEREPSLQGDSQVAIAHSAGMSVLSGAELSGADFDTVMSLGGAFALRDWRPDPGTDYHHFQYDNDAINMIDGGRLWTPHELNDVFQQHVFDSEGLARFESHSRIAEGPETNRQALDVIFDVMSEVPK